MNIGVYTTPIRIVKFGSSHGLTGNKKILYTNQKGLIRKPPKKQWNFFLALKKSLDHRLEGTSLTQDDDEWV